MAHSSDLSARARRHNLTTLGQQTFDLLVIGGGITGAGVARDAALRGLSVALVERRDFAIGTSSRSSKLIHGGIRYLQQGDVGLVIEAATERRAVRHLAPHLARPMHMLVPVHSRGGWAKMRLGLMAYDRLAKVRKDERYRMLDRAETLALEPRLRSDNLYGAALYYEYVTDDSRLVIANIRSAAALGTVVANYCEVTGFVSEAGRVVGATVRDVIEGIGGAEQAVRARVVVNAAGPWVDQVRLLSAPGEKSRLRLAKGIHVVVAHDRLPVTRVVVMQTPDRRSVFCVPRGDTVYLGTTDTDYNGSYDDPRPELQDVSYLLDAANATFSIEPLTVRDVVGAWAGLRPLLHEEGKKTTELSRKDEIMVSDSGLISIAGGKLTTFRKMAERVGEMVAARLKSMNQPVPVRRGDSESERLVGGETGEDLDGYAAQLRARFTTADHALVARLVLTYGSEAECILDAMTWDNRLRLPCAPSSLVTRGEVAHALHAEMVMTLDDFMERRSREMLYGLDNGLAIAPTVAEMIGTALGWSAAQVADAVVQYAQHVESVKGFQSEVPAAPAVASAAHV